MSGAELRKLLTGALNPKLSWKINPSLTEVMAMLENKRVLPEKWPEVMILLGSKQARKALHDKLIALKPFPTQHVVDILKDRRLAVRLGALEMLEELTGKTFGFDPWLDEAATEKNRKALAKWQAYAKSVGKDVKSLYSALTKEQLAAYIQDLVRDDRERSARAMRMLENGGQNTAKALAEFLKEHPGLPPGARKRLKEVQYSLFLPPVAGIEPAVLAHRLVFGTLDIRLKSIASLQSIGKKAIPVLKEFLEDPNPIVRETTADALVGAGGRQIVPLLAKHLSREKDTEVVYTILRGLGNTRSKRGLKLLISYLTHANEDLVIVALNSVARLKSKTASKEIGKCLADPRWRVRVAALDAVTKLKLKTLHREVTKMLDDKDDFVLRKAVKTLSSLAERKAAGKLAKLFLREDALKGPVVVAFDKMKLPLPKSFAPALEGKGSEVLLAVIQALEDCRKPELGLVSKFLTHHDLDVACAATRLIGRKGMDNPKYQKQISKILRSGKRQTVLAALESIKLEAKQIKAHQMLFQYTRPPTKVSPGKSSAGAESPAKDKVTSEDVLAAFMAATEKESPAAAEGRSKPKGRRGDALLALVRDIEGRLTRGGDAELEFAAALLLTRIGSAQALPFLQKDLSTRTVSQREAIAASLIKNSRKESLGVLKRLLRDPSKSVRTAAAQACLKVPGTARFVDPVFQELLREKTRLKPFEVHGYWLSRLIGKSAGRRIVRKWLRRILSKSEDPVLQNFALIVLEKCWKTRDKKIIKKFLQSKDPWQRRAAFHTLGKGSPAAFKKLLGRICQDPSEYVREVVPNIYVRGSSRWVHYLDKTHFDRDYSWGSSYGESRRLAPEVDKALVQLTRDASPKVRIEAFFCLLSNHRSVDLAQFLKTVETFPDQEGIIERVASYLSSNYRQLGQNFQVLIPYLERSRQSEDTLHLILKHFAVDPEAKPDTRAFVTRSEKAAEIPATFLKAAKETKASTGTKPLKLVYFTSHRCADCARAEKLFPRLREYFPKLEIETHNIREMAAMRLNELLCERFSVPEHLRLVTPAAFSGGGYLARNDLTFASLGKLLAKSAAIPLKEWYVIDKKELNRAGEAIAERCLALGAWSLAFAGLANGLNPCAVAAVILLLVYLQIARRQFRETAQVALSFIAGVFLAYLLLCLGGMQLVLQIQVLRYAGVLLTWIAGVLTLAIMGFSIRGGVQCLQGRGQHATLPLPPALEGRIEERGRGHTGGWPARHGVRHWHFLLAAFLIGVVSSVLALACTGQLHAPGMFFMLKAGKNTISALWHLAIYSLAFVAPPLLIFGLAYGRLKSHTFARFGQKHPALVKFLTAAVFLFLILLLLFGAKLAILLR